MDYIKRVTGMTTDKPVAVSQDRNSSKEKQTKQFLITGIPFDCQRTTV